VAIQKESHHSWIASRSALAKTSFVTQGRLGFFWKLDLGNWKLCSRYPLLPFLFHLYTVPMAEPTQRGAVEAEIAQLSRQIEEKRRLLEGQHGIVEEKELVRHVIAEKIGEAIGQAPGSGVPASDPQAAAPSPASVPVASTKSATPTYLDTLDDDTVQKINTLVAAVFEQGLAKTIKTVVEEDPFILDAFHDALVDKLYEELKKHKVVA